MKQNRFYLVQTLVTTLIMIACTLITPLNETVEPAIDQPSTTPNDSGQGTTEIEENKNAEVEIAESTDSLQPTPSQTVTSIPESADIVAPVLSAELTRGCDQRGPGAQPPKEGQSAIEFTLLDPEGNSHTLSELLTEKPVVLIFGSFT